MSRIENWAIVSTNPYQAPEVSSKKLSGKIYGDERFLDGSQIITSALVDVDIQNKTAKTQNTEYELGAVSEEYENYCKNNNIILGGI